MRENDRADKQLRRTAGDLGLSEALERRELNAARMRKPGYSRRMRREANKHERKPTDTSR